MTDKEIREDVIAEALTQINGTREGDYGSTENSFGRIAALWEGYMKARNPGPLTAQDVPQMMVLFKLARVLNSPAHRDSWVDLIGYGACGASIGLRPPALADFARILGTFDPD